MIQGPGDRPQLDLESFLFFDGSNYHGWTVSNLDIRDFDLSVGMISEAGGAFDNVTVTNNHIRVATDLNGAAFPRDTLQNIGILYAAGRNQTISGNQIDIPGDGRSSLAAQDFDFTPWRFAASVGIQSQTVGGGGLDGLAVTGNTITVLNAQSARPELVVGIWENGNADRSDIGITNNHFLNADPANDPAKNLEYGFWVTSQSNSAGRDDRHLQRQHGGRGGVRVPLPPRPGPRRRPGEHRRPVPQQHPDRRLGRVRGPEQRQGPAVREHADRARGRGRGGFRGPGPGRLERGAGQRGRGQPVTGFAAGVVAEGSVDDQGVAARGRPPSPTLP